jgi:hypothetical protein
MADLNTKVKFTTNTGRAQYPWLKTPDTAFGNAPKYKTNLIMDWNEASDLVDKIQELVTTTFSTDADKVRLPYKTDDETGETVITVKSNYSPFFFDSKGQPLVDDQIPDIWGGSLIRVGGFIKPYQVSGQKGITLQLTKVQVIEPVSGGGDGGGFETVEGGFVAQQILQKDTPDNDSEAEEAMEEATAADRF